MHQEGCHGWEIHRFDKSPGGVVSKPIRVHVGYVCSTTKYGEQIADGAVVYGPRLPRKIGP